MKRKIVVQIAHNDIFYDRTKYIEINCLRPSSYCSKYAQLGLYILVKLDASHFYQDS